MRAISIVTVLFSIDVLAQSGAVPSAAANAGKHMQAGIAHYQAHRYEKASLEFETAYTLDKRPEFLFAWAQARRLSGDCRHAVVLYRLFLDSKPPERQALATKEQIDRCNALNAQANPADATTPAKAAVRAAVKPSVEPTTGEEGWIETFQEKPAESRGRWYTDVVGGILTGTGVLVLGLGVLLFTADDSGEAEEATSYQGYADAIEAAEGKRTAAIAAFSFSLALVGSGVGRYIWAARF